jgi:hypothetical protein
MRILIVPVALLCISGAAMAAPAPEASWGKAGVSLQDYRLDATLCLRTVEHLDLQGTEPAEALVRGTRRIDTIYAQAGGEFGGAGAPAGQSQPAGGQASPGGAIQPGGQVMNVVEFTRPQHRINQIRALMRVAMHACLTELGYTRFRLTEEQREALRRLRYGEPERHAFLHRLASDPAVLAAQALPADAE